MIGMGLTKTKAKMEGQPHLQETDNLDVCRGEATVEHGAILMYPTQFFISILPSRLPLA